MIDPEKIPRLMKTKFVMVDPEKNWFEFLIRKSSTGKSQGT